MLRGLTEDRGGVELLMDQTTDRPHPCLTEVRQGRANHGGREVDLTRTIVGTIHTHPWDVLQSIADVRNLIRANDILGGVVTHAGRMALLVKHPDEPDRGRSPFAAEVRLQRASLEPAPSLVGRLGVLGTMSAAFDLPLPSTRDPYIEAVCGRLGLIVYVGDVATMTLRQT